MTIARQALEMSGKTTQADCGRNICVPVNHSGSTSCHGFLAIWTIVGNDAF
jgi:hypothetical protein